MRLRNHTDIPDAWIRAAVAAVRPPGISRFRIVVFNSDTRSGSGTADVCGSNEIRIRVARTEDRARAVVAAHGAYLPMTYGGRREAFLAVLAHELRHLWQVRVPRGRRVWGSRGQFSERDADAYALQMLRRYRRGELEGL